jgi:hypothetical protein
MEFVSTLQLFVLLWISVTLPVYVTLQPVYAVTRLNPMVLPATMVMIVRKPMFVKQEPVLEQIQSFVLLLRILAMDPVYA